MKTTKTPPKKQKTTLKTVNVALKQCIDKPVKGKIVKLCKTRDEARQEVTQMRLEEESERIEKKLQEMYEQLFYLDKKPLNPIDRHLMHIQYHILEAYASSLSAILHFERVRMRRRDGAFLERPVFPLMRFLFGTSVDQEKRIGIPCTCSNGCNCHKNDKNVKNSKISKETL